MVAFRPMSKPTLFGEHPRARDFHELTPEHVMDAVEVEGRRCTGRFQILNSYENRVYQLELEDGAWVVGKFYRPGRWSRDAILDEHDFLSELADADLPVVEPLDLGDEETIGEAAGVQYSLYPRVAGRAPEELRDDELPELGRTLARLHDVGEREDAAHRPELCPDTYGGENLRFLLDHDIVPVEVRDNYARTLEAVIERIEPLFTDVPYHRIHGDCHAGNWLRTRDGLVLLDFDDFLVGPAVQDVWMLLPSYDEWGAAQRARLLEGYREVRDFDPAWLRLVEPLRALRYVHYATWIARRYDDPVFRRTYPDFGTVRYWQGQTMDLREQIARIDEG